MTLIACFVYSTCNSLYVLFRFRDTFLHHGGDQDPSVTFRNFRGRDPSLTPFQSSILSYWTMDCVIGAFPLNIQLSVVTPSFLLIHSSFCQCFSLWYLKVSTQYLTSRWRFRKGGDIYIIIEIWNKSQCDSDIRPVCGLPFFCLFSELKLHIVDMKNKVSHMAYLNELW